MKEKDIKRIVICFYVVLFVGLVVFAGCSNPNPVINTKLDPNEQTGRIKVLSAQAYSDSEGHDRDILVLKDSVTGSEYLAVMGAGVSIMLRYNVATKTFKED